eukprot:gene15812-18062_t
MGESVGSATGFAVGEAFAFAVGLAVGVSNDAVECCSNVFTRIKNLETMV